MKLTTTEAGSAIKTGKPEAGIVFGGRATSEGILGGAAAKAKVGSRDLSADEMEKRAVAKFEKIKGQLLDLASSEGNEGHEAAYRMGTCFGSVEDYHGHHGRAVVADELARTVDGQIAIIREMADEIRASDAKWMTAMDEIHDEAAKLGGVGGSKDKLYHAELRGKFLEGHMDLVRSTFVKLYLE